MGIIKNIIKRYREKIQARNDACDNYILHIDTLLKQIDESLSDMQKDLKPSQTAIWQNDYKILKEDTSDDNIKSIRKAINYQELLKKRIELDETFNAVKLKINEHNERVFNKKISDAYELIGDVEGKKLDRQQMICIVKEAHNHLIIAGAGTGKTTTVVGKIKYLLKSGKYKPQDILVLSFTNASASEMCERICKETGENIEASTFHKLGLNIIKKVDGISPKISKINLRKFINDKLQAYMKDESYLRMLSSYLIYNRVVAKSEFDFKTNAEYDEYLQLNPPVTINKENVKSYGEMDIANFLSQNDVKYIYEQPYSVDTRTSEYGQYYPDFYLPEYDIYIEYFGVNERGEVPSYFTGKNGMTATQAYQASMKWKRETHAANNTVMVECYAYEKLNGTLQSKLKEKLEKRNVVFTEISAEDLWKRATADGESVVDGIIELFETLINLIKSNNYDISDIRRLNASSRSERTNNTVISLIEPIFNDYLQYLRLNNEIDFNDMINKAVEYVDSGRYVNLYKYVIVDEYQDISKARFTLLKSMRKSNDFDLFCVGDDWQSIYRFAGSDISYIINFERYWGAAEISRIETTYRFSQILSEISGGFIMKNPAQIKKSICGKAKSIGFALGEVSGYTDKYAIEFITKRLDDLPKDSSVFFIGRYSFDSKLLNDCELFNCKYNNVSTFVDVVYDKRPDLKMCFITAHKSKGLQADYIFIINNKNTRMGFPSKIQDAAILSLLLDNCDQYPDAEERRLFYVALTRAKIKSYIVTVKNYESKFVAELKEKYGSQIESERFACPWCGGKLLKKKGPYGEFIGCSNYRALGCTYKRKLIKTFK